MRTVPAGLPVVLCNLVSRQELNGQHGEVSDNEPVRNQGRVPVRLKQGGTVKVAVAVTTDLPRQYSTLEEIKKQLEDAKEALAFHCHSFWAQRRCSSKRPQSLRH